MAEQATGGKTVNIASIDALHPSMVGLAAYDSSKGGVLMFTKAFAREMAQHRVNVNAIAPSGVATEGTAAPLRDSGMTGDIAPEVDRSTVDDDRDLTEQLDLDSMDYLNWMVGINEATGVDIPQRDASRFLTIAGAVTCLVEHGAEPVG